MGNALAILGEREGSTARLEEAVAAYRAALEERTRERVPLDWAGTQYMLGHVLWVLGDRKQSSSLRCEALHSHTLVWGVLSEAGVHGAGRVAQDVRKESELLRSNPGSQGLEGCLKTYGKAMARRIATLERRK